MNVHRSFAAQRERSQQLIRQELRDLIIEARAGGYWLKEKNADVFHSPMELEALNRRNEKIWGAPCWVLIKTDEVEAIFERRVGKAQDDLADVRRRIRIPYSRPGQTA